LAFTSAARQRRLGHFTWSFPGLRTAVFVDGTLNHDEDRDRGRTVELSFP
jgi:hypothetical protein